MSPGKRTVHHADALAWLGAQGPIAGASMVTSLPDFSEFPNLSLTEWKEWFVRAVTLVLSRTPDDGVAIFFQTDAKKDGAWVDKAYLCQKAAEATGHELLWHKLVLRALPGNVLFGRPAYSHMLCFAKTIRADLGKSTTDVLPHPGEKTWARAMGLKACLAAGRFILAHTKSHTIVDPFCGHGTMLAVANELGLDAVGVELSRRRAEKAMVLKMSCHE